MCSWCWGFAPVLDQIIEEFRDRAGFRIIVGGLRPGEHAQLMTDEVKLYIRTHWQHVQEATRQPFNFEFFDRDGFVYDTEPAARAVLAVRALAPGDEFAFFDALQRAFYAKNTDITRLENLRAAASGFGIDEDKFLQLLGSESNRQATRDDFRESRQLGIQGFPSVILRNARRIRLLTAGYQPYENLLPRLESFLNQPML